MWDVFFWMEQNSALRFVKIRGDCLFEDFLALISACNNGIFRFTTNVTEILLKYLIIILSYSVSVERLVNPKTLSINLRIGL